MHTYPTTAQRQSSLLNCMAHDLLHYNSSQLFLNKRTCFCLRPPRSLHVSFHKKAACAPRPDPQPLIRPETQNGGLGQGSPARDHDEARRMTDPDFQWCMPCPARRPRSAMPLSLVGYQAKQGLNACHITALSRVQTRHFRPRPLRSRRREPELRIAVGKLTSRTHCHVHDPCHVHNPAARNAMKTSGRCIHWLRNECATGVKGCQLNFGPPPTGLIPKATAACTTTAARFLSTGPAVSWRLYWPMPISEWAGSREAIPFSTS